MFSLVLRRTAASSCGHYLPKSQWRTITTSSAGTSGPAFLKPRRNLYMLAGLTIGASVASYSLGSLYPPNIVSLLYPRSQSLAPELNDPLSPETKAYSESLEAQLQSLPALRKHRENNTGWHEIRPFSAFPEARRVHHFTAGGLRGPGKLFLPPIARISPDEQEAVYFVHLGPNLCGHEGIVHGGLLATILDESLGLTAMLNLPDHVAATAYLNITYRAPTEADNFVVIKAQLKRVEGRKAWMTGSVEDSHGKVLVEADALFVQPRYTKLFKPRDFQNAVEKMKGQNRPEHTTQPTSLSPQGLKTS